ncbi:hypothetical protein ACFVWL_15060 [Microbacterium sp. NPDC058269]|uniref:hypothetical protein n=1 Tax=Microbacterium sp. NPDC058269 TaxID=3346414 RepID=UPI0036DB206A
MTLLAEQEYVCRIDAQAAAWLPRALRPLEEPETDPEGETIRDRQATQFVGAGDMEDLAVLDIGRVDVAAMQRGIHDGSFGSDGGDGCGSTARRRQEQSGTMRKSASRQIPRNVAAESGGGTMICAADQWTGR